MIVFYAHLLFKDANIVIQILFVLIVWLDIIYCQIAHANTVKV